MIVRMEFNGDPEVIRDTLESWLKAGHMKSCAGGVSGGTTFSIKVGTSLPEPPLTDETNKKGPASHEH